MPAPACTCEACTGFAGTGVKPRCYIGVTYRAEKSADSAEKFCVISGFGLAPHLSDIVALVLSYQRLILQKVADV